MTTTTQSNGVRISPTYALQTVDGETVYGNGRGKYALVYDKWSTSIPTHERVGDSSPEHRAKRLAKAESQIGKPLEWVDGPSVQYILI